MLERESCECFELASVVYVKPTVLSVMEEDWETWALEQMTECERVEPASMMT